jgi:hypothetical protein
MTTRRAASQQIRQICKSHKNSALSTPTWYYNRTCHSEERNDEARPEAGPKGISFVETGFFAPFGHC